MARYPTFEEFEQRGNFEDGIKRCDELLTRNPKDARLHAVKLQLAYAASSDDARPTEVLNHLLTVTPPLQDVRDIIAIEDAVINAPRYLNSWPRPLSAGPLVAKLWDNASKSSSVGAKLEILSLRFERAILDNRRIDAQQALIQIKATQPTNRVAYMAHAALTQSLSKTNDDMSSRLAIGLARKAVGARFDFDEPALDYRVAGQIFAMQHAVKDLETIKGRPMAESKHVYDALRAEVTPKEHETVSSHDSSIIVNMHSEMWFAHEVDGLRDKFATIMRLESPSSTLKEFSLNTLRLLAISRTSTNLRRAPADATFLAVSALIGMWELEAGAEYLFYATYAAEMLLVYDEHIHEARLVLVYLYMRLGLGSLAMRMFSSLNVKEVQHDTIGHTLFTRLSITHPHMARWDHKDGTMDPSKRTIQALNTYVRCEDKLAETEASVLQHGQTGMLFDLQDLRDSLRDSLPRRIALLEHRRIARYSGNDVGSHEAVLSMGPRVTANWLELRDSRDFNAVFDFGYNVERPLHGVAGMLPSTTWTLYNLIADTTWCIASGKTPLILDPERAVSTLHSALSGVSRSSSEGPSVSSLGLTAAEYLAGEIACQTLMLLLAISNKEGIHTKGEPSRGTALFAVTVGIDHVSIDQQISHSEADIGALIKKIAAAVGLLNLEELMTCQDVYTEHLQDHYLYADVLRTIVATVHYARPRAGLEHAKDLQELQDDVKRNFVSLQQHAKNQRTEIATTTLSSFLTSDAEIWATLGTTWPKVDRATWCSKIIDSAKDGWDGVCGVCEV